MKGVCRLANCISILSSQARIRLSIFSPPKRIPFYYTTLSFHFQTLSKNFTCNPAGARPQEVPLGYDRTGRFAGALHFVPLDFAVSDFTAAASNPHDVYKPLRGGCIITRSTLCEVRFRGSRGDFFAKVSPGRTPQSAKHHRRRVCFQFPVFMSSPASGCFDFLMPNILLRKKLQNFG